MAKYLLVFSKLEEARFIGHLDLLKTFQRALRRAALPLKYSEGFNPHPQISFGQPLSLGMSGLAEFVEVEMTKDISPDGIVSALNKSLPDGLRIIRAEIVPPGIKPVAGRIRRAVYDIKIRTAPPGQGLGSGTIDAGELERITGEILTRREIHVWATGKAGKRTEKEIRALINSVAVLPDGTVCADIGCGGAGNLKPDVLAALICGMAETELDRFATEYTRVKLA